MAETYNPRNAARIARIKREVHLLRVLEDFGYQVRTDSGDREQQFPCDLHGDGRDSKPSARVYPGEGGDQHWYCWACAKSRDAIETAREKMGLSFMDAITYLERRYNLPFLPWDDNWRPPPSMKDEISQGLRNDSTFADDVKALKRTLDMLTQDRELPMRKILGLWEAFDKVVYLVTDPDAFPKMSEYQGRLALARVTAKITDTIKNGVS